MLRNRILLGVAPLIVLLMLTGGYAVWLLVRLGGAVDTTLRENYLSIASMREVSESASAIELDRSAPTGGSITSEQTRQKPAVARRGHSARGRDGTGNITGPGEREFAQQLEIRAESFWRRPTPSWIQCIRRRHGGSDVRISLGALLETVTGYSPGERAGHDRGRSAHARCRRALPTVMLLTILAALPLGLFFAFRLNRRILRPIES